MTDKDIIERIRQLVALFERETGRVPSTDQLASKLGIDIVSIRKVIRKFLNDSKLEGTSAFQGNLLEVLMGERMRDQEVQLIDADGAPLGLLSTSKRIRYREVRLID